MRIVLVQGAVYAFAHGGEVRGNRAMLEELTRRGHACAVVAPASGAHASRTAGDFRAMLERMGVTPKAVHPDAVELELGGVAVTSVVEPRALSRRVAQALNTFAPDVVLVSSLDPGQRLLEAVLDATQAPVVFLAHAAPFMSFGPASFFPDERQTALFKRCAGVIACSEYLLRYVKEHTGVDGIASAYPAYGAPPYLECRNFSRGHVITFNPCAYKGIAIFRALAKAMPEVPFAAVPGWGTTSADKRSLEAIPNVKVLAPAPEIDELLADARVVLAPSLWSEAFGSIVPEAMLRRVPVVSSDVGGLPEAHLGVDYVVPVRAIERYTGELDEKGLPVPVVPEQDLLPWTRALRELLGDPRRYEEVARKGYEAGLAFLETTKVDRIERHLESVTQRARSAPARPAQAEAAEEAALRARLEKLSPEKRALVAKLLAERRKDGAGAASILKLPRNAPLPLALAQERLFVLAQLEPESRAYNVPGVIRLRGRIDVDALRAALAAIVERHEPLRTRFFEQDGRPVQVVEERVAFEVPVVDLRGLEPAARSRRVEEEIGQDAAAGFDLARPPLVRAKLLRLDEEEHVLLVTMHHIVSDGWSLSVFAREAALLYEARVRRAGSPLAPLPVAYADWAAWHRSSLESGALSKQLEHWTKHLEGAPPLDLPLDHPRPATPSHRGERVPFEVPEGLARELRALAQRSGATLFMALLAGFGALLSRLARTRDVVVGTPVANRGLPETEGLIGLFVNTLALRLDLSKEPSFTELLARARAVSLAAFANQDAPFARVVEKLRPERDLSRSPLFDVLFTLQNTPPATATVSGLNMEVVDADPGLARFDLSLELLEANGRITGFFEYAKDIFERATIERFARCFEKILAGAVARPDAAIETVPIVDEADLETEEWLSPAWTSFSREARTTDLVEAQVARSPDAVAIRFRDRQLTYRALDARANALAAKLVARGVRPDALVGVMVPRSLEMLVSMLAVLKAGGAYVPMDPAYPRERLAWMMEDSGAKLALTTKALAPLLPPGVEAVDVEGWSEESARGPGCAARAANLAYAIYTSGSTGKPKGVEIAHRSLVGFLESMKRAPGLTAEDTLVAVTSLSFDIAGLELWLPLVVGARIELVDRETAADGRALRDRLERAGTVMQATPATWKLLLAAGWGGGVRVLCGGEALPPALARELTERSPEVWNLYGPTETTIWSSAQRVRRGEAVTLGAPIANTRMYVLDDRLQRVPLGVAGELYIGGEGLARGYHGRPDLTAERFVPDPFSDVAGARMYRTGDVARVRPGGALEYVGRADHQVKVRGFRIELGEIESTLAKEPGVREAVAVVRGEGEDKRIVAYAVPAGGRALDGRALREAAGRKLPEYMVPSAVVVLDALPLTPNGKIDRRALPAPEQPGEEHVEPTTEAEKKLAQIFADVLKTPRVSARADFFELGGHSLLAAQVMSRVRDAFGVEVGVRAIFEQPTVEGLARVVEAGGRRALPPLKRVERGGASVLSFAQERLWFLQQLDPDSDAYNVPATMRMRGRVDEAALERALMEILRRHEVLRTTYQADGGRGRAVVQPVPAKMLEVVDARALSQAEREERIARDAMAQKRRAFDLTREIPVRAELLRFAEDDRVLLLTVHHIAWDGVSQAIISREFGALYRAYARGEEPRLPEPQYQYEDYAAWQREVIDGDLAEEQLAYWKKELEGTPPRIELPVDKQPAAEGPRRGGRLGFEIPRDVVDAMERTAKARGATLFMGLVAAFEVLIQRYASQSDFAVATSSANRTPKETEAMVGFFVNTLLLRARLGGDPTVEQLLKQTRESVLGAQSHADVPFQRVLDELRVAQDGARPPFLQVMLGYLDEPELPAPFGDVTVTQDLPTGGPAIFDLHMSFTRTARGLDGVFYFDGDAFEDATITGLVEHFVKLLEEMARRPERKLSELELLSAAQRRQILEDWAGGDRSYPGPRTLHGLVAAQAQRTPDALAVVQGAEQVTYHALEDRAARLASALLARGVGKESLVGLCVARSIDMVVGVLGVMKAGAAYVPLDPKYPRERLRWMLEDAQPSVVVTEKRAAEELADFLEGRPTLLFEDAKSAPLAPLADVVGPANAAYVIYTSGSTGKPKGVVVEHGGACNLVHALHEAYDIRTDSRVLQFASLSFDAAVEEIFKTLTVGASLHLAGRDEVPIGDELERIFKESRITNATLPPSVLAGLSPEGYEGLRTLVTAGESCPSQVAARWRGVCRLVNAYGPTEATVCATYAEMSEDKSARNIGRPLPNKRVYVLGKRLEPVPVGVAGEVYLGGAGVARGYLRRPELTAERFIPDPYGSQPGARLYKTGDLARWRHDGTLEFLGRADEQIKVRGFRIEPGEIESALLREGSFTQAVVVKREEQAGDARLVAYVTPEVSDDVLKEVRGRLRELLPEYMVPSAIVALESLPLTPSGKIDVKNLPAPEAAAARAQKFVEPSTPVEREIAQIWREILGVERVGLHDDFFDLGGHSLLLTQVIARLRDQFGVEITLRALFDAPTLYELTALVASAQVQAADPSDVASALAELEGLTPDQIAALLAEESGEDDE
jgi:amino acid adenylation domain-containing protein